MENQSTITFEKLMTNVQKYIHKVSDLGLIEKAYDFAFKQHIGQKRKTGEPYIIHPLEVTYILSELNIGPNTLVAGLLHDVVEDTKTTLDDISNMFNKDVASIVDGVTKLNAINFNTKEEALASTHQKLLLAMAKDIRVILVKLADRLHNMRTMDSMASNKQAQIAKETLDIYAPLAHKLGIFKIKAELEDRSLKYINPRMYYEILSLIKNKTRERVNLIDDMINDVTNILKNSGLKDFTIKGRIKNVYSIYKKMVNNNKSFEDIYDLIAIRIILNKVEECYQALGVIHANYTPIPKRFKDYIALPKPNLYQSLHTTVLGAFGEPFEVQIRTEEMDEIAEGGVAAHWAYKESKEYSKEKEQFEIASKLKWYGELLQMTTDDEQVKTAEEFVDTIKEDLLDDMIYIFTPKGEVIDLPKGSTPLDFAYKIHTDIGNKTVGAIVNNKMVPLSTELKTGDICSIKTNKNSFGPSEDWLKIVKTNHARNKIRTFLNKQNRDILIDSGKQDLDQEIQGKELLCELNDEFAVENFSKAGVNSLEDLYVEIGKKLISPKTVAAKLIKDEIDINYKLQKQIEKSNRILTTNSETGVCIEGLTNPQLRLGNCCNPIPGDEIIGYVSKGNGIIVHTKDCNNLGSLENNRFMDVFWATNIDKKYLCRIKITAENKPEVFPNIISVINSLGIPIAQMSVNNSDLETVIKLKILVHNIVELEKLIANIKKVDHIYQIERDNK